MRFSRFPRRVIFGIFLGTLPLLTVEAQQQETEDRAIDETSVSVPVPEVPQPLPLEELQVFAEVFGKIKSEYIEEIGDGDLLRNAIQGMLRGLDPHSSFLDPEVIQEVRIATDGRFGGIGVEVTTENNQIKVVAPIDGTPAYEADIRSGDIIVRIDGEHVHGASMENVVDKMRGDPGTSIVLTVSRAGVQEPFDVSLIRSVIKVLSVRVASLEKGIGYARISSFQSGTATTLRNQIEGLQQEAEGRLDGLVLDLRNNPGGVLSSAVDVSDLFLEAGNVVTTRGRGGVVQSVYEANAGDILAGAPIVVLVNNGSASASEIVAGALQDNERAIIMGTRTFGKGSVQTLIPVHNGGALKLTTSLYYTPLERSIQAQGIKPDLEVRPSELREIRDSLDLREDSLPGHLPQGASEAVSSPDPEGESEMNLLAEDYQLREAFNLLKGLRLVRTRSNMGEH